VPCSANSDSSCAACMWHWVPAALAAVLRVARGADLPTKSVTLRQDRIQAECCSRHIQQSKVPRNIYEEAREVARACGKTEAYARSRRDRKKVEMLFAHLKRILRLDRLRLRGPSGAQFEFTLAAIAQNLRRLAKIVSRPPPAIALRAA